MSAQTDEWRPIASAPKDGTRVLAVVRATEQGPAEVDVVRWGRPTPHGEECWVASDSNHDCVIVYAETELVFWMPLPSTLPKLRTPYPDIPAEPYELSGSGI